MRTHWTIEEETGYKPMTTFWDDFSIADAFGIKAVKDTYTKSFRDIKSNYKYLTEFVMVLNWKLWQHYNAGHSDFAKVYNELWQKADDYAYNHLKGEELHYFIKVTD